MLSLKACLCSEKQFYWGEKNLHFKRQTIIHKLIASMPELHQIKSTTFSSLVKLVRIKLNLFLINSGQKVNSEIKLSFRVNQPPQSNNGPFDSVEEHPSAVEFQLTTIIYVDVALLNTPQSSLN